MAKKHQAPRTKSVAKKANRKTESSVSARVNAPTPAESKAAAQKFVQGILKRGEAVPAGDPMTPGVTHEIVGKDPSGNPVLKRNRFSAI